MAGIFFCSYQESSMTQNVLILRVIASVHSYPMYSCSVGAPIQCVLVQSVLLSSVFLS